MGKGIYNHIRRRWNNMGALLAIKRASINSTNHINKYSDKEIKEIYELETNYSNYESFDKLWNKKKRK